MNTTSSKALISSQSFATLIKLRHLSTSAKNNWEILTQFKTTVTGLLGEADQLMQEMGSAQGRATFQTDVQQLHANIAQVQGYLDTFATYIHDGKAFDSDAVWAAFEHALQAAAARFSTIGQYPNTYFSSPEAASTWREVWEVIRSNSYAVQGVGEAALLKVKMMENFDKAEADSLMEEIVKHIPPSFNLLEANQYKVEFLQAMQEMEEEANKKDNLWDRFLNVLAGGMPFKQSPAERVMMRRWLEGEKGEL